jgi:uncharacterized protein YraI
MRLMSTLMTGAGLLALSTGFAAAAPAVVQQDLNLRAGPGIDYDVIAAMPSGATVDVMGCEAGWCRVAFGGTTGFASRGYLGLGGGVAVGPAYGGYEVGYTSGAYAPAYGYDEGVAYGGYSPGYGYYGAPAYRERFGVRESERTFGNERGFGERRFGSAEVNARGNSEQRAGAIKGNNPMRIRESTASNQSRAQGRAEPIGGNNPMRIRAGTAASNQSRVQGRAEPIGGNNPMRIRTSTTGAGRANATTGAAPRENRRAGQQ